MPNCANEPESDNPLLGKGWNEVLAVAATSGKLCHLRHSGTSMDCLAQTTMAQSSPNAEPRSGSIQKQKAESRKQKAEARNSSSGIATGWEQKTLPAGRKVGSPA